MFILCRWQNVLQKELPGCSDAVAYVHQPQPLLQILPLFVPLDIKGLQGDSPGEKLLPAH